MSLIKKVIKKITNNNLIKNKEKYKLVDEKLNSLNIKITPKNRKLCSNILGVGVEFNKENINIYNIIHQISFNNIPLVYNNENIKLISLILNNRIESIENIKKSMIEIKVIKSILLEHFEIRTPFKISNNSLEELKENSKKIKKILKERKTFVKINQFLDSEETEHNYKKEIEEETSIIFE